MKVTMVTGETAGWFIDHLTQRMQSKPQKNCTWSVLGRCQKSVKAGSFAAKPEASTLTRDAAPGSMALINPA
jgi:hypothetical protein